MGTLKKTQSIPPIGCMIISFYVHPRPPTKTKFIWWVDQGSSLNSIEKALLPLFKSESNSVLLEKVTCIIKVFILSRSFDILSKVEIDFIPIPIFSSNFKSNTFFYERTLALKK